MFYRALSCYCCFSRTWLEFWYFVCCMAVTCPSVQFVLSQQYRVKCRGEGSVNMFIFNAWPLVLPGMEKKFSYWSHEHYCIISAFIYWVVWLPQVLLLCLSIWCYPLHLLLYLEYHLSQDFDDFHWDAETSTQLLLTNLWIQCGNGPKLPFICVTSNASSLFVPGVSRLSCCNQTLISVI